MMRYELETSRRGFILVLALMLLAMAAVVLAATARNSTGMALAAVQARQRQQRAWANLSIRHAALEAAPYLLLDEGSEPGTAATARDMTLRLDEVDYRVTVSDEQAKVNINALLEYRGREAARAFAVRQAADYPGFTGVVLPHAEADPEAANGRDAPEAPRGIVSFNQLIPGFDPAKFDEKHNNLFDGLTCWGSGQININRAADALVKEAASPLLGSIEIDRLRDALTDDAGVTLQQALSDIGVKHEHIPVLLQRLTTESRCYSVWIKSDNGTRRWHELSVVEFRPDTRTQPDHTTPVDDREAVAGVPELEHSSETPGAAKSTETYPRLRVFQW